MSCLRDSAYIHIKVVIVYTGIMLPTTGMNFIKLSAVDFLFLVIVYSALTIAALGMSPITGIANNGISKNSMASAITERPKAVNAFERDIFFFAANNCMIQFVH